MNYVLMPMPTLEHIALIKVAATLWNQSDVRYLLSKLHISMYYEQFKSQWVEIEDIAVRKVQKLPLPNQMKEKILCFIRPVGLQIAKWSEFHYKGCFFRVDLPTEFCWTPQGTIHRKKTAEILIKDQRIDITKRYKLACIYCLEDDIPKLWAKIPGNSRISFYTLDYPRYALQTELVILWTYQIKGEMYKMDSMIRNKMEGKCSPHQYAFELSAMHGNIVATDYFLQKLTAAEREESLVKIAKRVAFSRSDTNILIDERTEFLKETYSDILFFILSQLDEEHQLEVFKSHYSQVVTCLLDWPWQNFFMETANRLWNFFPQFLYPYVFTRLTGKIIQGYKDFNYQKLFQEWWKQSPPDYKRHVLSDDIICRIVSELFQIRDKDNIKLIFQDATPEEKRSIIYRDEAKDIFKELTNGNQLCLLKYFIKECLPSIDEVVEFKEHFENGIVLNVNESLLSNWQQKFLHMLDEIIFELKK